jgi:hypothetical protein
MRDIVNALGRDGHANRTLGIHILDVDAGGDEILVVSSSAGNKSLPARRSRRGVAGHGFGRADICGIFIAEDFADGVRVP